MVELKDGTEVRLPADGVLFDALKRAGVLRKLHATPRTPWTTWGVEDEDEQGEFIRAWISLEEVQ